MASSYNHGLRHVGARLTGRLSFCVNSANG